MRLSVPRVAPGAGILDGMSAWNRVLTIGAAVGGGFLALLGYLGLVAGAAGELSGVIDPAVELAMSVLYLAIGAWLLYRYVRMRSSRAWVNTLIVMSVILAFGTGTFTYQNVAGDWDDRNWPLVTILGFAAAFGLFAAARHDARQNP